MRSPSSHKGENGKVCIIGGSRTIHGAPILAALAAERSGADLIFVCLPRIHNLVAKQMSLNFQVHPFENDELETADIAAIHELLASMDACVIGPGLARDSAHIDVIASLIQGCPCPMVIDASALQPQTLAWVRGKIAVLTPHLGELERMEVQQSKLSDVAKKYGVTIHLKGQTDLIAAPGGTTEEVTGGNAGLTVGGTGDVLAGTIAGLIAQGESPAEACALASKAIKTAAETFGRDGTTFTAHNLVYELPAALRRLA
jgi:NAD(P)H-hydrate epimerase